MFLISEANKNIGSLVFLISDANKKIGSLVFLISEANKNIGSLVFFISGFIIKLCDIITENCVKKGLTTQMNRKKESTLLKKRF